VIAILSHFNPPALFPDDFGVRKLSGISSLENCEQNFHAISVVSTVVIDAPSEISKELRKGKCPDSFRSSNVTDASLVQLNCVCRTPDPLSMLKIDSSEH
jgi:hypothetical protein